MSEKVKLIIEIDKDRYNKIMNNAKHVCLTGLDSVIAGGIPLDSVKAEIDTDLSFDMFDEYGNETRLHKDLMEILDNIGRK